MGCEEKNLGKEAQVTDYQPYRPLQIYVRLSFPNRMNVQHVNLVEARIASAPGPVGCSPSQATQSTSSSLTRQLLSLRAVARLRMRRPSVYVVRSYGFQALGATPQQASSSSCQACATHHKRLPGTRTCGSTFTLGSSPQSRMRHVC